MALKAQEVSFQMFLQLISERRRFYIFYVHGDRDCTGPGDDMCLAKQEGYDSGQWSMVMVMTILTIVCKKKGEKMDRVPR